MSPRRKPAPIFQRRAFMDPAFAGVTTEVRSSASTANHPSPLAWGPSLAFGASARVERPLLDLRLLAGSEEAAQADRIARTALEGVCMPLLRTSSEPSVLVSTRFTVAVT